MSVKINQLEIENIKRVRAVTIQPSPEGLTIVGGRNNQGKTSVLDAIAWAVGGDRFKPTDPVREGSAVPPKLKVTLSNGLVVERKGPNSSLKVIDPQGNKNGQQLLNEFVEALALDLPRFLESSAKDKAKTLLQIVGVGDKLYELETEETRLYNERHSVGLIRDQKQNAADEMPSFPDAPAEPVSASDLIKQQQEILAKNGENQRKREQVAVIERDRTELTRQIEGIEGEIKALREKVAERQALFSTLTDDLLTARKTAEQLEDESTAEIEAFIAAIDEINTKVRTNQQKSLVEDEAREYKERYLALTDHIEGVRTKKLALLDGADLPLPGLSVQDGELTYDGRHWDGMSGSEQLRVATAIVRRLNPQCGFVLLDKLEQMDLETLGEFNDWLVQEGLQVIATRVSTGGECSIVIEDGYVKESDDSNTEPAADWKKGQF